MSAVDRQFTRFDQIEVIRENTHSKIAPSSFPIEGLSFAAAIELDMGFDGMIPDPILDADLVRRLEKQDSH